MKNYKLLNNVLGWAVFVITTTIYMLTAEPTVSFWDCGEYISTAYKLQVGHPPGAPLFQLAGRFFTLFAFGDTSNVAYMINIMSAVSSGFTILFLFWTITLLTRKFVRTEGEMTNAQKIVILGSGMVGSLAYGFSDTFWFSAVEGEVYAMSSFFTAIVFWAILRWEQDADKPNSLKWLLLIAYLMGLSIGVHLLNLLAIPAITFVYYFKKYKPTRNGIFYTLIISFIILAVVMYGIIPLIVKLAGSFELFFVNSIGMPFNSGTIIYFIFLVGGIIAGLVFSIRKQKLLLNTILLAFTFILIGYSSFFLLVIRSNANTPINENNPADAISLLSYLNREQYGDWPVFNGQYYNAPVIDSRDGNPVYRKDASSGKYVIIDDRKDVIPVYDPRFTTIFPRMWSNSEDRHATEYETWAKIKGEPVQIEDQGETKTINKPTFSENLRFFFRYQLNHMYFRYFMWNFAGRQNDIQGNSDLKDGNWISGFSFIDDNKVGKMDNLPPAIKSKAYNRLYFLPLIAGLLGLYFHFKKSKKDAFIVSLLFVMTGLAIVVYLNQYSPQPRERDYAYAASFYAFAIWIGLGVAAVHDLLKGLFKRKPDGTLPAILTVALLFIVPVIMIAEEWDDHDRSGRTTALAMGKNYLNSCAPNAILFTNGDNDTFPLWYAQEVEGIRTDVRVVNLSLLNTEWYIDQMKHKAYDSDPVPFSLTKDKYKDGTRNFTYFTKDYDAYLDLKELFSLIRDNEDKLKLQIEGSELDVFPSNKFHLPVDSAAVVRNGTIQKKDAGNIVSAINWTINRSGLPKNYLMVLDLLAHNDWKRPVYFSITTGSDAYIGLEDYFQLEGLAYRLVPIKANNPDGQTGSINTGAMYKNLLKKFDYDNMKDPGIYLDETNIRMTMNLRNNFFRLANALLDEGKMDSAVKVIDHCLEVMPENNVPYNYFVVPLAEGYYRAGEVKKANALTDKLIRVFSDELQYFFSFTGAKTHLWEYEKQQNLAILQRIVEFTLEFNQQKLHDKARKSFETYYKMYVSTTPQ